MVFGVDLLESQGVESGGTHHKYHHAHGDTRHESSEVGYFPDQVHIQWSVGSNHPEQHPGAHDNHHWHQREDVPQKVDFKSL